MSYKIELYTEALEDLKSLDSTVIDRILKKLDWLKDNFEIKNTDKILDYHHKI